MALGEAEARSARLFVDDRCLPEEIDPSGDIIYYHSGVAYFRRAIRDAVSFNQLQAVSLAVAYELEQLQAGVSQHLGYIPPRYVGTAEEAREKGWGNASAKEKEAAHG